MTTLTTLSRSPVLPYVWIILNMYESYLCMNRVIHILYDSYICMTGVIHILYANFIFFQTSFHTYVWFIHNLYDSYIFLYESYIFMYDSYIMMYDSYKMYDLKVWQTNFSRKSIFTYLFIPNLILRSLVKNFFKMVPFFKNDS